MTARTILVLGGGVGGVVAANTLRRLLDRRHRVVLVDREPDFTFAASLLWVMNGRRRPGAISRPLARLERRGIEVVRGEVESIDPARKIAVVSGRTLESDYLLVALGADFAPGAIPGLADGGETFCTLDGATRLRESLARFRSGRLLLLTAAPAYKCPAAPYEAAMLAEALFRERGVRAAVEIELHSAEPAPMPVAGPAASAAVREMIESRGIAYRPGHQVARVEKGRAIFTDGGEVSFDLLVHVPPLRPPRAVASSGLADESGWVRVDSRSYSTRFPDVFAIGDVTLVPLAVGKPLPRAGVFAHAQAEVVARNIAAAVAGRTPTARFDGHGACFIETGDGRAGFGSGNFYAEPSPAIRMRKPSRFWHAGKVLFEKRALWGWL
jgi:sulfide:quinone oxidoreductase